MIVGRTFYFDASHHLTDYEGACERVHGHTYRLEIQVEDEVGECDMVLDFGDLKNTVKRKVLSKLDHCDLNEIMENPTAENIVEWIWGRLEGGLNIYSVKLWEGEGKWALKTK